MTLSDGYCSWSNDEGARGLRKLARIRRHASEHSRCEELHDVGNRGVLAAAPRLHPQPCRPYQNPITVFVSNQAVAGAMVVLRLRGLWTRVPLSLGSLEVLAHILLCELVSQTRTLFHLGRRLQYPPQGTVTTPIPFPSHRRLLFFFPLSSPAVGGLGLRRFSISGPGIEKEREKMCCAEMDTPFRFRARAITKLPTH